MLNQKPFTALARVCWVSFAAFGVLVAAGCGGGGGNPGIPGAGSIGGAGSGGTTGSSGTTIKISLVDGNNNGVPNNTMTVGNAYFAKALVKKNNAPVAGAVVVFGTSNGTITMNPLSGTTVTDQTGTAQVQLSPRTITPTTISATTQDGTTSVADSMTVNGQTN